MDDTVREGFICPICRRELDSLAALQDHFETAHSSEDKAGFKAVKGLVGWAKRKIRREDAPVSAGTSDGRGEVEATRLRSGSEASGIDPVLWAPQEFGTNRDHFREFKRLREDNLKRTVIETNKKVIRLEKLYDGLVKQQVEFKADSKKRKAFEQGVVAWLDDALVSQCPYCEKNFNLRRRKHHCRLCGKIICNSCTEYIALPFAASLTKAAKGGVQKAPQGEAMEPNPESDIRTCFACLGLLLRRSQQLQDKYQRTPIIQLYEYCFKVVGVSALLCALIAMAYAFYWEDLVFRMTTAMEEAASLQPRYLAMAESLNNGELNHSLVTAEETRHRLIKMFETVDAASKRILAMVQAPPQKPQDPKSKKGKDSTKNAEDEPVVSTRELHLHKQIRLFASRFLQEHMVSLPGLPDAAKLKRLQAERSRAAEEKARRDRETAERAMEMREMEKLTSELQAMSPDSAPPASSASPPPAKPSSPSGWQPKVTPMVSGADPDGDPLLLQRDLLRGYIQQARQANRFDEVEALSSSLRDIEMEIARSRR